MLDSLALNEKTLAVLLRKMNRSTGYFGNTILLIEQRIFLHHFLRPLFNRPMIGHADCEVVTAEGLTNVGQVLSEKQVSNLLVDQPVELFSSRLKLFILLAAVVHFHREVLSVE